MKYAYPEITFIPDTFIKPEIFNIKEDKVVDGVRILPIRWSESIMGRPYPLHMVSKYDLLKKDWRRWKECAYPNRNKEKEKELAEKLGIVEGEEYTLVATKFGSDGKFKVDIKADGKVINMDFIAGFSLFDWCGIIQNAKAIHAVSSSSLYLFEILGLKATEIHLYCRKPHEQNLDFVRFLFTKDYILHE